MLPWSAHVTSHNVMISPRDVTQCHDLSTWRHTVSWSPHVTSHNVMTSPRDVTQCHDLPTWRHTMSRSLTSHQYQPESRQGRCSAHKHWTQQDSSIPHSSHQSKSLILPAYSICQLDNLHMQSSLPILSEVSLTLMRVFDSLSKWISG